MIFQFFVLITSLMKVDWKVHRLTEKELCHSNENWHALNSTFPNTNCIVSFHIKPHRISNSGLWKVVLEAFQNGLENWRRESWLTKTVPLHTSLWLQWQLCMTVALNRLITLHCPDLAPSDYFQFSNIKKLLAGKQCQTNDLKEEKKNCWLKSF